MRGKGPSKPVPQEITRPVGTSLGPGDGVPVILHPLVDWGNASDCCGSLTTHTLARKEPDP